MKSPKRNHLPIPAMIEEILSLTLIYTIPNNISYCFLLMCSVDVHLSFVVCYCEKNKVICFIQHQVIPTTHIVLEQIDSEMNAPY